jgi:hypothetical protein
MGYEPKLVNQTRPNQTLGKPSATVRDEILAWLLFELFNFPSQIASQH